MSDQEYQIGVGLGNASHDNPFQPDGELSGKADYILSHSLFSRSEIRVSDPDLSRGEPVKETVESPLVTNASPPRQQTVKQAVNPDRVDLDRVDLCKAAVLHSSSEKPAESVQVARVKEKEKKKKSCCTVQ